MTQLSDDDRRRAFSVWLRTGRLPTARGPGGIEIKFNPWHDPETGRFTIRNSGRHYGSGQRGPAPTDGGERSREPGRHEVPTSFQRAPVGLHSRAGRGSNSRAFEDPMTLEQAFPGLRDAPGGAIVAAADTLLDLSGPAVAA
jgi:hypothetical protein